MKRYCIDCARERGQFVQGRSYGQCKRHWVNHLRDSGLYDANKEEIEAMPDSAFCPDLEMAEIQEAVNKSGLERKDFLKR